VTAGDWALLALAAFAVVAVTANLRLDFLAHLMNVRRAYRNPGSHTGPGFAADVAERIRARAAKDATGPGLNQMTQAMPPLVPTGTVRIWRGDGELFATEGIAWGPNAPLVVCRDPENPRVWAIIHRPTGGVIRSAYDDPEDALMAVGRLSEVCDWASPEAVIEWEQLLKEEAASDGVL
jgi:hypothetical protein